MSPQEILLANELVITMINVHNYVPHKDHGNFREVVRALQEINPKAVYKTDCSGCMSEIGRIAQIHLDAYKATLANETATFHTFPLHEKQETIGTEAKEIATPIKKGRGRPKRNQ